MIASWVGTRTNEELSKILHPGICKHLTPAEEHWSIKLKRLLTKGTLFDFRLWIEKMKVATRGDTTFLEAYRRTGKVLSISTTVGKHRPAAILNCVRARNIASTKLAKDNHFLLTLENEPACCYLERRACIVLLTFCIFFAASRDVFFFHLLYSRRC